MLFVTSSAGRRSISSERELERLRPGDVLVCPTTHSSWTVVFGKVGALVTDGGGATSAQRDGQIVTVDRSSGRVFIHT